MNRSELRVIELRLAHEIGKAEASADATTGDSATSNRLRGRKDGLEMALKIVHEEFGAKKR